jgi:hypothetical protein
MRDINTWLCKDCGIDTFKGAKNYYMVTDLVWNKYGLGEKRGMLCIKCLETRMDRKLQKKDILDCPLTRENPYTKELLLK